MQALSSTPETLSPLLLSIAGRVGHAFEVQTMIAGFTCHARGVAIEAADTRRARAIVKSQRPHTVDFRVVSGKLFVKCSCPAESMGIRACKHTWAALLEIDKQGALGELRTKRGPVVLEREFDAPEAEPKSERKPKAVEAPIAPTSEVKRKPGRPKKVAIAAPAPESEVKRKPGRPKKVAAAAPPPAPKKKAKARR